MTTELTKGNIEDYYDVKEVLGRGAFGEVKKCIEKSTNKVWAAKFLRAVTSKQRESVQREIDVMRDLSHDCVIRCHQIFQSRREITLILECVTGGELFERIVEDENGLTEYDCVNFTRQICMGVDHIHKNNIIHLDLKPENIMCLDNRGYDIKIIDFGLARRYQDGDCLKILAGTPEFLAPEVIKYDDLCFGSDMWAVGVICYVMLSGLSPFLGDTDHETLANVADGSWDFDDEIFDTISAEAKSFISKLLVRDKRSRMSAEACLQHTWLARPVLRSLSSLVAGSDEGIADDVTIDLTEDDCTLPKEKLKTFVGRRKFKACAEVMSICRAFVNVVQQPKSPLQCPEVTTTSSHNSGQENGAILDNGVKVDYKPNNDFTIKKSVDIDNEIGTNLKKSQDYKSTGDGSIKLEILNILSGDIVVYDSKRNEPHLFRV